MSDIYRNNRNNNNNRFIDFYREYNQSFRMSYSGDEIWLLHDRTEEEYRDYNLCYEALDFITGNFPDINENTETRVMFLIHYNIMKICLKRNFNGFEADEITEDIKDLIRQYKTSGIHSPVFEYVIIERYGLKQYENIIKP